VAAVPRIQLHPKTPWALRLFDRIPLPPLWVGVGIGLAFFALYLTYTGLFSERIGLLDGVVTGDDGWGWAAELIQDFFIGFALAVSAASIRGARRDLGDLLPHLDTAERDPEQLERDVLTYQRGPLLAIGLVVGAGVAILTSTDPSLWVDGRSPGWQHPSALWLAARNFVNWWVVARAMVLELMLARDFSRLGDRLAGIDLLDRTPLEPFGRRALRNVLLWMLLAAFLSLTYLGEGWASEMMPLALVGLTSFALAAFLLPLLGAHRRIRELKYAELARVRAAIREAHAHTFAHSAAERPGGGRLADLVSYEARIAGVGEWPIDASTLLRFALYLAIGLGSWVGAAVVERVLETALG
jgi:hypothetical protein